METEDAADAWIGRTLGHYRIEAVLARGGMGVVYRARDTRLDRPVALKLLREDLAADAEFRERFVRESRAAAALDHPNILPVFDAGETGGVLYIATRLVDGVDLRRLLQAEGRLPAERALALVAQVAAALDYAHARGVLHRDVKPANVLLVRDEQGDAEHVYLIDFGVSKRVDLEQGLTATGQFFGTPEYVAPEQVAGRAQDGRADQYALACLLHACVAGAPPFADGTAVDILHAQLHRQPPSARAACADVPPTLDAALARALAKAPDERFASCRALVAAARADAAPAPASDRAATRILSTERTRRQEPPPQLPREPSQRSRGRLLLPALAVLVALAGLGVAAVTLLPGRAQDPAAQADAPTSGAGGGGAGAATGTTSAGNGGGAAAAQAPAAAARTTSDDGGDDAAQAAGDRGGFGDWPAGFSGYTLMLASMRYRTGAVTLARQATAAGLEAGILRSDDHGDLRPGYWVVFSGAERDAGSAEANVSAAQEAGFSDAYVRHVDAASGRIPAPEPTVRHERSAYALRLPRSWQAGDVEVSHDSYVESSWKPAGAPPHVALVVDHTPGYDGTPEDAARQVRDLFPGVAGYRELGFQATELGAFPAWRWEFDLRGARKVDWFVTACDTGYALLGAAPADEFDAYLPTFESAALSLLPRC